MIRFIVTKGHAYTVRSLAEGKFGVPTPPCTAVSYQSLFTAAHVPAGTYVFCDLERLSDGELLLASDLYRALSAAGRRVLNDPARAKTRYALLRGLHETGLNAFDAYRADGRPRPRRFPVFIRAEAEHKPALTGLLPDQASLEEALCGLVEQGKPLRGLVVIEYCSEPVAPNVFRRYGAFRVGGRMHLDHVVTEDSWNVKWGKMGLVGEEQYKADDVAVRENLFQEPLARAFDVAGLDYGRADFNLVDGQPQVYEINTNPTIGGLAPHASTTRMATMRFSHQRFADLLHDIDTSDCDEMIAVDVGPRLAKLRRAQAQRDTQVRAKAREEAARAAQVVEERNRLAAERDRLVGERDRLAAERDQLLVSSGQLAEKVAQARTRMDRLRKERGQLIARNAQLAAEGVSARKRLQDVLNSRSWRLAAPLRAGGWILRRLRRT